MTNLVGGGSGVAPAGLKVGEVLMGERLRIDESRTEAVVGALPGGATISTDIDPSTLPVFQQAWFLEVGRCREARVFKGGALVGSLPYFVRRMKIGAKWGGAPDWSNICGPVVSASLSDAEKFDVLRQLIAQLPSGLSYGFVCGSWTGDVELRRQVFAKAGFSHFIEPTYCQPPSQADVLSRLNRKHRLHFDFARRTLHIVELDGEEFVDFYSKNLAAAALPARLPLDTARALIAKARLLDPPQVRVVAAKGKAVGAPFDAAIACVWDKSRYYYWMSTRRRHSADDPHNKPNPDAVKLLLVNAMAHAQSLGLIFDTDGCNSPGSKTLYEELLRIPNKEFRDVFQRMTPFQSWYIAQKQRLEKIGMFRFAKRVIQQATTSRKRGSAPQAD